MAAKRTATRAAIDPPNPMHKAVETLAVLVRQQREEADELRKQIELQARQIEYLRARLKSADWCGIWDEGWPTT